MTSQLSFLRSRRALARISLVTLACAAAGVLYALLAPQWYSAVLTVVPASPQKPNLPGMLGTAASGLVAGLEPTFGGSDASRIAAVLQSVAVSDAVIDRFHLRDRYGTRYLEDARETLWSHCEVTPVPKPNLVRLSCEDRDPRFVQEMVAYFAEHGNKVFRQVNVSSASEEARFLEKRVAELRQQADDAAGRLRDFEELHKIVDLDTQAKAVVSALATLNNQKLSKELELNYARTFASRDEASTQQIQSQLSVMGGMLQELEQPPPDAPRPRKRDRAMFPAALEVPKLRAEFEALFRDRRVTEATLVFALERLESARANEARDVSTLLVLDPPVVPTRRSRPKRTVIVLAAALSGLAASLAFEWVRSVGGARGAMSLLLGGGDGTGSEP